MFQNNRKIDEDIALRFEICVHKFSLHFIFSILQYRWTDIFYSQYEFQLQFFTDVMCLQSTNCKILNYPRIVFGQVTIHCLISTFRIFARFNINFFFQPFNSCSLNKKKIRFCNVDFNEMYVVHFTSCILVESEMIFILSCTSWTRIFWIFFLLS